MNIRIFEYKYPLFLIRIYLNLFHMFFQVIIWNYLIFKLYFLKVIGVVKNGYVFQRTLDSMIKQQ